MQSRADLDSVDFGASQTEKEARGKGSPHPELSSRSQANKARRDPHWAAETAEMAMGRCVEASTALSGSPNRRPRGLSPNMVSWERTTCYHER